MTTDIRPLNYLILVKPDRPEQISDMLEIPDEQKKQAESGVVLVIGPKVTQVSEGERIRWEELAGKEIKDGDEEYILVDEDKVLFAYGTTRETIN